MYQWRTEYIGDNSAVGNITDNWFPDQDAAVRKDGCELQTSTEPYEVTVQFVSDESAEDAYDANVGNLEQNAALFFSLVHNAGIVNISINGQIMNCFTRADMEDTYGDLWSKSETYEEFCKTYDYVTYLQNLYSTEEKILSLDAVISRIVENVGTDNALSFNNTADVLPDKDALIKLCVSQDGKYEAYGCVSPEYGFQNSGNTSVYISDEFTI